MLRICLIAALSITPALGAVTGRVVEDHSGNPLVSAEVRVYAATSRTIAADLETDGDGNFQVPDLPEGDYRIEAGKANYAGATLKVRLPGTIPLIRLKRKGVIAGQVLTVSGQPLPS